MDARHWSKDIRVALYQGGGKSVAMVVERA
jgi:hypothetical protein